MGQHEDEENNYLSLLNKVKKIRKRLLKKTKVKKTIHTCRYYISKEKICSVDYMACHCDVYNIHKYYEQCGKFNRDMNQ